MAPIILYLLFFFLVCFCLNKMTRGTVRQKIKTVLAPMVQKVVNHLESQNRCISYGKIITMPSAPIDYDADLFLSFSSIYNCLGQGHSYWVSFLLPNPHCLWTLLFIDGVCTAPRLKPQWKGNKVFRRKNWWSAHLRFGGVFKGRVLEGPLIFMFING